MNIVVWRPNGMKNEHSRAPDSSSQISDQGTNVRGSHIFDMVDLIRPEYLLGPMCIRNVYSKTGCGSAIAAGEVYTTAKTIVKRQKMPLQRFCKNDKEKRKSKKMMC